MNLQVIKIRVLFWLKTLILYGVYIALLLVISSFFILQIPAVQSSLAKRLLRNFSEVSEFKTSIEGLEFYWFDRVIIKGLRIEDPEQNIMIGVNRLMVNFKFTGIFQDSKDIRLDAAVVDSARVNFKTINDGDSVRDLNINVFVSRINAMSGSAAGGGGKVTIGEAIVRNSHFDYNTDRDTLMAKFDPNHFSVSLPDAELQNFVIVRDTVQFNVRTLTAMEDKIDFKIHELTTFFRLSQQGMQFEGLKLRAGQSVIADTLLFQFTGQKDLGAFVDSVSIHATFSETVIHPDDLALFAPIPSRITQPVQLKGEFNGRLNKFRFTQMDLRTGATHLQGSLEMDGLPDINETFILLALRQSQIDFNDLAFLFNENTLSRLEPLGLVNFRGQFLGYPTDFVATGDFTSQIGRIISDINLKVNEESIDLSEYAGNLKLSDFDLGKYLGDTLNFQQVNINGELKGKGLTIESADFTLNGAISSIGFRGYDYQNITTNARFASEFFNGTIKINDPNLEFDAEGSIDLRNNLNSIKITGSLDTANLQSLNLSKKKIFLQTKMKIDIRGLVLDSLLGTAQLNDVVVLYEDNFISLDSLLLTAQKEKNDRQLKLETSLFDAEAKGNFHFSNLFRDIPTFVKEFRLNLENDAEALQDYYDRKTQLIERYTTEFEFHIKDIRPVTDLLNIDLNLSKNTSISGRYANGPTTVMQFYSLIDSIEFGTTHLYKTELDINASKTSTRPEALAMVYVQSRGQEISKIRTSDLITELIWNRNHIDVDLSISQPQTTNRFDLNGTIDFRDSTLIQLQPSTIRVLDRSWDVHPDNFISIRGMEWTFRNIGFTQSDQSINVNGHLSQDSSRELTLSIQNFDLTNINPLIIRKLEGRLNAELILNNFFTSKNIQNTLLISDFKVDEFLFGDITGNNTWDPDIQRFNIEFYIDRLQNRIVSCNGYYNPGRKENPLNITARFNKANLKIFEPFIDDIFSQFQGTLTGNYTVTGTLPQPIMNGEGRLENGAMLVNYLNTTYQFTGLLGLTPTSIYFKDIELTDAFRNRSKLNGALTHTNFKSMQIALDGQFDDFQVLNTTAKDNSLFYGQAYASGVVRIAGPLNNLVISATATTRRNTRLYIPISGSSSVEQKDYINFVSFKDSTYLASQEIEAGRRVNLTGLTLDFNIDVTPDAYCEIIFDLKAGDIVRGRGNGKLKLQLDTKGEFNMFGPIEFTEGWYNFTLYDIINKEFQIQPGSNITWFGDPYQGTMKIDATYNQLASLSPILTDPALANVPQLKRKYPVQVLLKLDGPMLSPLISFDIVARDLPKSIPVEGRPPVSLDIEFVAFKSRLDEQELKRQVFSLIVLRRFSAPESFSTSGSLVNSVSELFSNQLSYWLSQVDENLEIDVDLGSMDQEAFNAFQLRMSYTFMSGRLRITRDGTLGNQTTAVGSTESTRNELASAIGDWTVDYLLSPDGKFKVKMYSRTNVNPLVNNLNSQSAITTGVSLMHTQSFNEVKDLLRSSRDRNRRTLPPEDEPNGEALKEEDDGG
jgi:hypothetical protein